MKPCPTVSVVIPGYNESHLSRKVLQDVKSTADLDYEIIFVDDGSTDDTEHIVNTIGGVTYIKHSENKGVPCAWNTGIMAAKGDYVLILNNDIEITDPSWMSKMVNNMKGRKAIVGPEKITYNSATEYRGNILPYINGWCFGFPRRIFIELGLFDEIFSPGGMEDVDYCVRAVLAGYQLVEVPLRMQHQYAATRGKYLRSQMQAIADRNRILFLQKMDAIADRFKPKTFVFDCPDNMKAIGSWGAYTLEGRGLGGAETALTLLTRELASRGHTVKVFNDIPSPDTGEGVQYYPRQMILEQGIESDCFVVFRSPSEYLTTVQAKRKIFWSCDQGTAGDYSRDIFPYVDDIICISDYHANYFKDKFKTNADIFKVIGCPVKHWDYEPHIDKNINQFLFCSVPHRGLEYMPMVMSEIRQALPEAELVITSDYRLWGVPQPRNNEFPPMFKHPNDKFLGKIPRNELIQYQLTSMAQPYPCTYLECFCIAVAECAAAGAVPVTTDIGAVPQTVGKSGFIVGEPKGNFAKLIAAKTLEIYGDMSYNLNAIEHSWRWSVVNIANKWLDLLDGEVERTILQEGARIIPSKYSEEPKVLEGSGDTISYKASQ